jgi:hypothetical protein
VLSCARAVSKSLLPILIALALFAPCAVHAQTSEGAAARLTARGRFMPSGSIGAFWSNDEPAFFASYGSYATWNLEVAPSLVYFVRDDLGVGLAASFGYQRGRFSQTDRFKSYDVSLGVNAIWNVRLGGRLSLMVQPFVGYAQSSLIERFRRPWYEDIGLGPSASASDASETEKSTWLLRYARFGLALPLVFAISDAVGIGVGPDLLYDLCFRVARISSSVEARSRRNRARIGAFAGVYASF